VAERVESELDSQATNPLTEANRFYAEKFRLPLTAQGAFPRDLRLSSTSTHLELRMLAAEPGQAPPPTLIRRLDPRYDIAVYGHESVVANLAEPLVGGKTFDDKQFLELIRILTGSADRGLWVFDGRPRWNVTFAKRQPIQVKFNDGVFRLSFHFASATCGNDTVQAPIEVAATFRPEITTDGVRLIRQSAPTIVLADDEQETSTRAHVRQQLTERFSAFFQEDLYFDGLAPPAGGTWAKIRELKLTKLACENGWFTIGYELNEPSKVAAQPK
jgi:hypothetical protein